MNEPLVVHKIFGKLVLRTLDVSRAQVNVSQLLQECPDANDKKLY